MVEAKKSLRAIFDEASEIEGAEQRHPYLDRACEGDPALRANIEELPRSEESAGASGLPRRFRTVPSAWRSTGELPI